MPYGSWRSWGPQQQPQMHSIPYCLLECTPSPFTDLAQSSCLRQQHGSPRSSWSWSGFLWTFSGAFHQRLACTHRQTHWQHQWWWHTSLCWRWSVLGPQVWTSSPLCRFPVNRCHVTWFNTSCRISKYGSLWFIAQAEGQTYKLQLFSWYCFPYLLLCYPALSVGLTVCSRLLRLWPFSHCKGIPFPSLVIVHVGCLSVASIYLSRTWTSASYKPMWRNAWTHRQGLGLQSHPNGLGIVTGIKRLTRQLCLSPIPLAK